MEYQQVVWACEHDWYRRATQHDDGTWTVHVRDELDQGCQDFTNFNELRVWAGY